MDNLCHTLTGAAFGEAGLKQRTRYGNATLMIAANLPDIDVLAFATSTPAVALRRGWTHGVAAQMLLPLALATVVWAIGRRTPAPSDAPRTPAPSHPRTSFFWLLALSYIGVYSHVAMDWLNNYGVRLLTPFDWSWFYGDAIFIIDPWLWLSLGLGVWLARRRGMPRAAQFAVVIAAIYIGTMVVNARLARASVLQAWQTLRGSAPQALMVGPMPIVPASKAVIVDAGGYYETGTFSWPSAELALDPAPIPKNADDPRVVQARTDPDIAAFLVWSRFPFWTLEEAAGGTRVTVSDVRFAARGGGFAQSVVVPRLTDVP